MMAQLGSGLLLFSLILSLYAALGSVLGAYKNNSKLVDSSRYATYLVSVVIGIATINLVWAFVARDFSLEYVAAHSNRAMDHIYTWVALYAGNEGSLLFIALVLSVMITLSMALAPVRLKEMLPYANFVMMSVATFFIGVMVFLANPFDTLPFTPLDGQGINPLLRHPGMFIHPPILMTGLIGMTLPFSFAMGALISGKNIEDWVDIGRVWGLIIWAMLGIGLLLGAWWAYTILGWGGYWAWDPIENAALMPWLVLTAFVHSAIVQKRRGMFRMWNVALVNISFTLALFGIFINRGGPVPSVHSFGASNLGWVFLAFLGVSLVFSFLVFFLRYDVLKGSRPLESMLSREASFLINNLLLIGIAFVTLWGVIFPLVSELFTGATVTVGEPFYNQVNGPIFVGLIFLMGIGPLLSWRRSSLRTLRRSLFIPGGITLCLVIVLLAFGMHSIYPLIAFAVCFLVVGGIFQEWIRGTFIRHQRGDNYVKAFISLIASNRPRYGGYIVHLAIVVLAFGVIGSSFFNTQKDAVLAPGEKINLGKYTVEYLGESTKKSPDRTEYFNTVEVSVNDGSSRQMTVWRAFYPDFRMVATRAAIWSTPVEDFYIVSTETLSDGRVIFRFLVNPLVWWMWLAGPIAILGTVVALWPKYSRPPMPSKGRTIATEAGI
jgi:cytochrome c-type biogenesis protein CcmF